MAKHIHAEMMMQYAQDAMETPQPYTKSTHKENQNENMPTFKSYAPIRA